MKSLIFLTVFMLGASFMAHSQQILSYQVDNNSSTHPWEIEIDAGYQAVYPTDIAPLNFIKGTVDIKSVPITWTAYKGNGCMATGTFSGPTGGPISATVFCPPGQTASAQFMASNLFVWPLNPLLSAIHLYVRLN
jgi:hypothetical protein